MRYGNRNGGALDSQIFLVSMTNTLKVFMSSFSYLSIMVVGAFMRLTTYPFKFDTGS